MGEFLWTGSFFMCSILMGDISKFWAGITLSCSKFQAIVKDDDHLMV